MTATVGRGPTPLRTAAPIPTGGPLPTPRAVDRPPAPYGRAPQADRLPMAITAATLRAQPAGRVVRGPARERHEPDHLIQLAVALLAALGILMVHSSLAGQIARSPGRDLLVLLLPELLWVSVGVAAMLLLSRLDYRWLRLGSIAGYALAVGLLVLVLLPPVGPFEPVQTGGASRWLRIGDLPQLHPAELAKLALVVYLAHWLARRGPQTGSLVRGLLPFLVIAGTVIALIALEPDLGTTGVVVLSALVMFFVAGGSVLQMVALAPLGAVVLVAYVLTNPYQLARWETFLDPWSRMLQGGFHTVQGLYALALGGVLGTGLGESRGPGGLYLPNADNDYVFAMVGQELGLVGGLAVIGLLMTFAYRGLRVARHAPDEFGELLAVGITSWLTLQALINIGVVVNLLPVTGITLPFVSSGGTSLVVSFAAVGILLSISRETHSKGTIDDAHPDRGRRDGRPHLPGAGGPARPGRPGR